MYVDFRYFDLQEFIRGQYRNTTVRLEFVKLNSF